MNRTKALVDKIVEGIQEKKGRDIVIADLTQIDEAMSRYFVICQGNSPSHLDSIIRSVAEMTDRDLHERPVALDGLRNAEWVAMDFVDVVLHVFLPEQRQYYNLENLWADAQLSTIANLD